MNDTVVQIAELLDVEIVIAVQSSPLIGDGVIGCFGIKLETQEFVQMCFELNVVFQFCLLYTSDAADEL